MDNKVIYLEYLTRKGYLGKTAGSNNLKCLKLPATNCKRLTMAQLLSPALSTDLMEWSIPPYTDIICLWNPICKSFQRQSKLQEMTDDWLYKWCKLHITFCTQKLEAYWRHQFLCFVPVLVALVCRIAVIHQCMSSLTFRLNRIWVSSWTQWHVAYAEFLCKHTLTWT